MFNHLKNIETAFQHIKRFSYILIVACALICGFAVYKSYEFAAATNSHVYILANGKALEAFAADVFFDDQAGHCELAREVVATGHVPHGISNEPAV